ncbi:MAG: hypothetical protein V3T83_04255 [Acidobacteriota bacterium]
MGKIPQCILCISLLLSFAGYPLAQAPGDLQQAHGGPELGRAARVLIEARLEGGEPVLLKIRNDQSRLEASQFTAISDGRLQQWWRPGSDRRSPARNAHPGLDNSLLMPFRAVLRLADDYRDRGASEGRRRFERTAERRRFLGAGPERWKVSLEFDPATGLLAGCTIEALDGASDPIVIAYSDYRQVQGIAVPFRVTRHWGDRLELGLTVESVAFQPPLPPTDFEVELNGGQP